jgi:uncharacterized lipoprotein
MKRKLSVILALALALLSAACKKEERSERVAASYSTFTKATERPLPKQEPQKVTVGIDAVPVEEDYEARAASSITEANLSAKLAELERELRL